MKPNTVPKPWLILLDYDGTLTDFKKDPNQSLLPAARRRLLEKLRTRFPVVLVTGRNLDRLYQVSGLRRFPAVGTHGFEERYLPAGLSFAAKTEKQKYRQEAARIWNAVHPLRDRRAGVFIEKKPFSSTLHYRGASLSPAEEEKLVREFIRRCRQVMTPDLWTLQKGKKMVEVMPKGFSKGKAVWKIMEFYRGYRPFYAGDDVADIPALLAVRKKGGLAAAIGDRIPGRYRDLRFKTPALFTRWLGRLV